MAFFDMHYYSKALKMQVELYVVLPEINKHAVGVGAPQSKYKTVYLLHGLSGDHSVWMRRTSIERYADELGVAVVMPNVARSWYADTAYDANYFTFVAQELPAVCQSYFSGMSDARCDNFIAGLSMGGYGALRIALTYPEKFGGCASLSGALDITRKGRDYILEEWQGNFGFNIESALELEGSCFDLFALTKNNIKEKRAFPKLYIWCGTEDSLLPVNREFRDLLKENSVEHIYMESEGDHSWKWWDMHIQPALRYLCCGEE